MRDITCAVAQRRLDAFHDGELAVMDQIAIGSHVERCEACSAIFADLRLLRDALRVDAGRRSLTTDESAAFQSTVVNRMKAERDLSLTARLRGMFDDMHLVYAGLGATVAMLLCVMSVLTMMRFATHGRPDSLAAIVNVIGSPGSNQNPVALDARILMPVELVDRENTAFSTLVDPAPVNDAVYMIRAVVTREGTVENPELVHASSDEKPIEPGTLEAKTAESLMGAVARARFEPARAGGLPVAVNMVWMVANTTVRADKHVEHRAAGTRKPVAWYAVFSPRPATV